MSFNYLQQKRKSDVIFTNSIDKFECSLVNKIKL